MHNEDDLTCSPHEDAPLRKLVHDDDLDIHDLYVRDCDIHEDDQYYYVHSDDHVHAHSTPGLEKMNDDQPIIMK